MARVPARPEGSSSRLGGSQTQYRRIACPLRYAVTGRIEELRKSAEPETKVEEVNSIRNIFDTRMHRNAAVRSGTVATAGG
jgi:hypothetical protein